MRDSYSSYNQATMSSSYLSPVFDAGRSMTSPLRTVQASSKSPWTAKTETKSSAISSSTSREAADRVAQSSSMIMGASPSLDAAATARRQDAGQGGDNGAWPEERAQNLFSQTHQTIQQLKPWMQHEEARSVRKVGDVAQPFPSPEEERNRKARNDGRRRVRELLPDTEKNVEYLRKRGSRG